MTLNVKTCLDAGWDQQGKVRMSRNSFSRMVEVAAWCGSVLLPVVPVLCKIWMGQQHQLGSRSANDNMKKLIIKTIKTKIGYKSLFEY